MRIRPPLEPDHPAGVRPARAPQGAPVDLSREPWWDDHTRPAVPRRPPPAVARPRPLPSPLPAAARRAPGRHAAPRRLGGLAAVGAAQLAVVAVVVAVGLAVTCWWLVRGSAHPATELAAAPAAGLAPVTAAAVTPAAAPVGAGSAPPSAGPATVTVDVAGKVRHPGIAVLDAGARVVDALAAAGGARPGVDLTGLNLARALVDGEQVVVGEPAPSGVAAQAAPSGAPSGPVTLVDLNTATADQLDALPEIGPVTAASILAWRDEHGGFSSVDELLEVDGIGEATLGKLAPYVTV